MIPPDVDIPPGEGPVDPNINLEDAPAWQFGNLQQQGGDGHGWGNWDAAEHNEDFEPPVPVPDEVNAISSSVSSYPAASSYSSVVSLISVSSSQNEDLPSVENAIVAQSNDVTTEHLWIMYQRFPQIMFDNMFFKDTSFWSTFSGGAGPSGLSSQVLPVSSLNSDDSSFEEILMPVPLAVVPPTPMTITALGDQALPSSDLQGPPAFPLEKSNSAKMKKTGNVTPLVTTGLRRSSRLLAINDGHKGVDMMEPDPNQGVGKPRGKSVKKLKQVAHDVGLLFPGSTLQDFDFPTASAEAGITADCSIPLLQKIASDLCDVAPQDVTQDKLMASASKPANDGN